MVVFLDLFLLWRGLCPKRDPAAPELFSVKLANTARRLQSRARRRAAVHASHQRQRQRRRRLDASTGQHSVHRHSEQWWPRGDRTAEPPCPRTDGPKPNRRTRMRARHLDGLRAYGEERRRRERARCGLCRHSTPSHTPHASPRRRLADATPGIAPLDFGRATVINSNLGEHRGRLLAHGTACPDNPTFGCIGNSNLAWNSNNHAKCCTQCAQANGGSLGLYNCGMTGTPLSYHGSPGTAWNKQQCGCSTITAVTDAPLLPPSSPPSQPPASTVHQPGIAPLDFVLATVANSNLGGLCGHDCSGKLNGTDTNQYSTTTGLCTYEPIALTAPCGASDMYYTGLVTTQSGTQVDLRVTNASGYLPLKHSANGLSGQWGAVQVLGNTETDFLFEFVDNVRTSLTHARRGPSAWPDPAVPPHRLPTNRRSTDARLSRSADHPDPNRAGRVRLHVPRHRYP